MTAALYVLERSPYRQIAGVDCWDKSRDARRFQGPGPVVAHPPCGPWGRLYRFCTEQDETLAPLAVHQIAHYGGVLEHPKGSRLWKHLGLPLPGQTGRILHGRFMWTLEVEQCRFGHTCLKETWLLFAGVFKHQIPSIPPWREPTHILGRARNSPLKRASRKMKMETPLPFARWLVAAVRSGT